MDRLARLNELNDIEIIPVTDARFSAYGKILKGYDVSGMIEYMKEHTPIPESGNIYVPSDGLLEGFHVMEEISSVVYGSEPVQAGYCNGRNSTYNGFEYHKASEINVAVSDMMLVLGKVSGIKDNTYDPAEAEVFFIQEGTVIEMFGDTLHLSPLKVTDEGFRDIVILPRGTNTPLSDAEKALRDLKSAQGDSEARLLLQKRKWVIAHPERTPLISQGACPGMTGENKELFY